MQKISEEKKELNNAEAATRGVLLKKVFLEISQNSHSHWNSNFRKIGNIDWYISILIHDTVGIDRPDFKSDFRWLYQHVKLT